MKILLSSICLETGTDIQLALYYLKGYLLKIDPSYDVIIRVFNENQNIPAIVKKTLYLKPDLIGFSCYIWNIKKTLNICRRLKEISPGLKIVLGGPEVSPRAEEILAQEKAVDAVVRGEGEESFAQFAQPGRTRTSFKRGATRAALGRINGISLRKNKKIIRNPDRPPLRNVNKIPSPYLSGLLDLKDKSIVDVPLETRVGALSVADIAIIIRTSLQ
ncbi:MAG: cobalamin-dependent protein [Candidatus Omnitrophota bacterium]